MSIAFFSCGAGDFLSIESFLTDIEREQISHFYLFTRAAETIKELICLHPIWKDKPVTIPLTPQQIRAYGVYSFFDLKNLRQVTRKPWPEIFGCGDYSGEVLYPQILRGDRKYHGSGFEVEPIKCDVVCDPVSLSDDRMTAKGRNFTDDELDKIGIDYNDRQVKRVGVAHTSVKEALGLVAGCREFVGVDSMLSCWAARQPSIEKVRVKTINPIYRKWLRIYDPLSKVKIMEEVSV